MEHNPAEIQPKAFFMEIKMPPFAFFLWASKWVAEMSIKEIIYGANPYQYVQYG